jgi:hypothetical protein
MEINKQLFEDVLSGKLKGTFVLRNGNKVSHKTLHRTTDYFYPYAVSEGDTLGFYSYFSDSNKFATDIIDFIPDTDMKENELTIEIPEGKIVDWDESKKQNKIILKDKPLTYEDVCKKLFKKEGYYFVYSDGYIGQGKNFDDDAVIVCPNHATTKHQLECILAKNKLANVAVYLNNGWKPSKGDHVFAITYRGDFKSKPIITEHYFGTGENLVLFQTPKDAIQAIEILGEETIKLALEPLGI